MTEQSSTATDRSAVARPYWMIYAAGLFGGLILLADALGFVPLEQVTARLAIGLIYSTFVLMIGKGSKVSVMAALLIWAAIIATFIW